MPASAKCLSKVPAPRHPVLLDYGANSILEAEPGSAYEFAFRRLYLALQNTNLFHQRQLLHVTAWTDDARKEVESNRTVSGRIETQLDIMEMLCDSQGRPVSQRIRYDEGTGEISTSNDWLGKKGLKIKLRSLKQFQRINDLLNEYVVEREIGGDRISTILCRKWAIFVAMDDAWHGELQAEMAARGGAMPNSLSPFVYGSP